jgi:hypothetical protein
MSEYNNNLSGALFRNESKAKDTDPAYKGSCEINGNQFWLSSWLNQDKNGKTYMKLKFTAKDGQVVKTTETAIPDEDIPF